MQGIYEIEIQALKIMVVPSFCINDIHIYLKELPWPLEEEDSESPD